MDAQSFDSWCFTRTWRRTADVWGDAGKAFQQTQASARARQDPPASRTACTDRE
jgi:hypothetical protein